MLLGPCLQSSLSFFFVALIYTLLIIYVNCPYSHFYYLHLGHNSMSGKGLVLDVGHLWLVDALFSRCVLSHFQLIILDHWLSLFIRHWLGLAHILPLGIQLYHKILLFYENLLLLTRLYLPNSHINHFQSITYVNKKIQLDLRVNSQLFIYFCIANFHSFYIILCSFHTSLQFKITLF